jgi:hypothetical protein
MLTHSQIYQRFYSYKFGWVHEVNLQSSYLSIECKAEVQQAKSHIFSRLVACRQW